MEEGNIRIASLIKDGIRRRLWTSTTDASRVIDMSERTLRSHTRRPLSKEILDVTIRKLEAALAAPARNACMILYEEGVKKELWLSQHACAMEIGAHPDSLKKILDCDRSKLNTKNRKYFERVRARLARKVGKPASQPKVARQSEKPSQAPPVVESDWFDALVAGGKELPGQTWKGIRFIITQDSFAKLKGVTLTEEEIRDTILLMMELRRRFNIIAQIDDADVRRKIWQSGIGPELDLVVQATRLMRQVVQTHFLQQMDRSLEAIAHFHAPKD